MLNNKTVHIVIMAGGSGKRLWPLSRSERPKQFIKLNGDKTLLEESVDRVKNIFENQKIYVVTTKNFEALVERLVGRFIDKIIVEPEAKNTALAVLFSCLSIKFETDDIIIFLPSDHHIPDFEKFGESLKEAVYFATESDSINLVGIKPTYPSTGFGYIAVKSDHNVKSKNHFKVDKFHEKPNLSLAQKYFNSGDVFWNSGIICSKISVLLDNFQREFPEIKNTSFDNIYKVIPAISFDYAILEKSKNIDVVIGNFSWSDVGTLDLFIAAKKDKQNQDNLISIESSNNLIEVQNKLVVLVGINDLCIVQTDDVLLISTKKDIDKVRDVLSKLDSSGKREYF